MMTKFDKKAYAAKAREVMSEGIVMLRNDNEALPLAKGTKVALFGRGMYNYYKSGTGSGGMVNTDYVTGVKEAIEQSGAFVLNAQVKETYDKWIAQHPYDAGHGWGTEPWFQQEMPLDEDLVKNAAAESEAAIVIIGRTAGEDQDNKAEAGSYYLTEDELDMIAKVTEAFSRTIVLLNTGNIIDMNWVEEYDPEAVLYIWQGGQEGGNGVLDILTGDVTPSGKLADTIAYSIEDNPAYANFGDKDENIYAEDIYVGYRYFETFAKDKVQYPFGFGLSYTTFEVESSKMEINGLDASGSEDTAAADFDLSPDTRITLTAKVTNTGSFSGKEVVQAYVQAPQGKLGQPAVSLTGYAKTTLLAPGESGEVTITFAPYTFASYDDSGVTGHPSCYVLEAGDYTFLLGTNCRELTPVLTISIEETLVVKELEEALAPVHAFDRMKPQANAGSEAEEAAAGTAEKTADPYTISWEPAPLRTLSPRAKRADRMPAEIPYTGDQGYKLWDVQDGKITMDTFIAQLADQDLCAITRGEGMNSPKVTPGTGGSYGGMTDALVAFGIPTCCCSDGPSGIRMDCGNHAFAMPNGTSMACSFNDALIEEMYEFEGLELRKNRIEALLGPGINLHRYPLNGRNFEYFSEDPLLTGKMAAAQLRGMDKYGTTGTIKHFATNNQEYSRNFANAVVSERALRQLYLKCFEIALTEGKCRAVMTTYSPLNGQWTAGNYDLLTTILRGEWGFDGFAMTDWWAQVNDAEVPEEAGPDRGNTGAMVRAQNDVYMVVGNAENNSNHDNIAESLAAGKTTRSELQRTAANVCRACMNTAAMDRLRGVENELDKALANDPENDSIRMEDVTKIQLKDEAELSKDKIDTNRGGTTTFQILGDCPAAIKLTFDIRMTGSNVLAQAALSIFKDRGLLETVSLTGADTEWKNIEIDLGYNVPKTNFFIKFYFGQTGMEVRNAKVILTKDLTEEVRKYFG